MNRELAVKLTKSELTKHNLTDWHVKLTTNIDKPFLGLCSYKDKTIILNAHHLDIHGDTEVVCTIKHEVAHALTPGHAHDSVWADKAKEIGCDNTLPCSHLSFPDHVIDAIRSGDMVELVIEEETQIIRRPKYVVTRLQDKCPECGKIAEELFQTQFTDKQGNEVKLITLKCFHIIKKIIPKGTPFESMVSNDWKPEIKDCKHDWNKTICNKCGEFKLYKFQIDGCRAAESGLSVQKGFGIFDDMGLGKVSSVDTPILTINGWKRNGDLQIGDLVISEDGNPYPITGLFPQGIIDLYKVFFSDGSTTNCGDEHLWTVNTAVRKKRGNDYLVKSFKDLKNDLYMTSTNSSGKLNNKWYIPITKPVNFNPIQVNIDPYLLGLLIGDGSFSQLTRVMFTNIDKELIDYVNWKQTSSINDYYCDDPTFKHILSEYGLMGTKSNNKFIPKNYKFNSVRVRLELLRGLMDTDGSIWNNGVVEYTTVSQDLARDVIHLVESLGGVVKLTTKDEPKYQYKGETLIGQKAYRLVINIPINPFKLERKSVQWDKYQSVKKYNPTRAITGYEYIGKEEGQCISIASPNHTYLTESFIVTHNTVQGLAIVKFHDEYTPTLYIVKSALKFQWFKEIVRWLGPSYMAQVISTSKDFVFPNLKSYIIPFDLLRRFPKEKLPEFKLIMIDECQQIKNVDSTRTQEVRKLVGARPDIKVLPLSGTPWKNRGSEFFPVLNMISPTKFHSNQAFLDRWVEFYWEGNKRKQGGIKNPAKFREYVNDILIRREYNEVMDEFPDINRMKLSVQLDELSQSTYDDEVSEFVEWYNQALIDGTEDSLSSIELLGRMARMRHITGLAKIPATVGFAEEFIEDTDRKLVIFVHHKDVASLLYDEIKKLVNGAFPVYNLTADDTDVERYEMAEQFNKDVRAFMIASTLASGEGLNLQSCADSIMHERQWNPQNEDQAFPGRFRRIGQKSKNLNGTYVEADDTVDQHIGDIVENKRSRFHEVMNKGEAPQWNESEVVKDVAKRIVAKHKEKNKGNTKKGLTKMAQFRPKVTV